MKPRLSTLDLALGAAAAAGLAALALRLNRRHESFRGKVAIITGGSRGLGLALARQLAAEGARLGIFARDASELGRAVQDLERRGADVLAVQCDVSNQAEVQPAIYQVAAHYGRLDLLINNAGTITVGPLPDLELSDFEEAMAIHAWAPLFTMKAAIPYLRTSQGAIINIASIGGKIAVPHLAAYSMSKFALVGLSDAFRAELALDKIRVTTVCPGLMRTGSHLNARFKGRHREEFSWFALGATLPASSIGVRRAARQILNACRKGQAELTITLQARAAVIFSALFPNAFARLLALVNQFLPAPAGRQSETKTGWESRSAVAPSFLTRLGDEANAEYNGQPGYAPISAPKS